MNYTLIVFDCDGTLVSTKSGETFRKTAADWKWLPGRQGKLIELKRQGVHLACATNQGGVAFGYMQQEDILRELQAMLLEVRMSPAGLYVCYTHPKATIDQFKALVDNRRKPGPGMLLEAMQDFEATFTDTLSVGDRPEDEEAAKNCGVDFQWSQDFFKEVTRL